MPDDRVGPILATGAAALCVLLVAGSTVLSARRRRAERLLAWARANGWILTERPPADWARRLPGGNRNGVGPALSGHARGRPVTVAEYSVTDVRTTTVTDGVGGVATSDTPVAHFYIVVVTRVLRPLPDIDVEPRTGVARLFPGDGSPPRAGLARVFPGDGSPSGDPRFDRAFRLRTADPAAIPAWCTAPLIQAHLDGLVPAWTLTGAELMTVEPGRLTPATVATNADRAANLAALLDQEPER